MNRALVFLYVGFVIFLFWAGLYQLKTNENTIGLPTFKLYSFVSPSPSPIPPISSASAELVVVKRVIDGDTIELSDGRKVRYIGIDTPELHHPNNKVQCFGKEAMEKNRELVEGKEIRLIRDISDTDRYKRLLRYIYIGDPSAGSGQATFINEYLVREGYARQSTFPPDVAYVELFKAAAEEARMQNKGLWSLCK